MELRILKYFLAVARESISGAAQALHMTQPTPVQQLMDLEEELGKQLLIRGSHGSPSRSECSCAAGWKSSIW